jgi:D-glycero-alpha-D-manno-heptose-7-phosphate kinase
MIIVRAPFRISFFGGGTDYPSWYNNNEGLVFNATIDKYCYICCRYLPPFFKHRFRIRYSRKEEVNDTNQIRHPTVRSCLEFLKIDKGIEMVHTSDLPARSGIGSSSSFTVAFLKALYALKGEIITKHELALKAIHIEQTLLQENIGAQDQTAASYGGLNRIEFSKTEIIRPEPIILSVEERNLFQSHLLLFFTGFYRNSSEVAGTYVKKLHIKNIKEMKDLRNMVDQSINLMYKRNFKGFGSLLDESWQIKKSLSKTVTNNKINSIYEKAKHYGAYGGKLCGSGGGGFFLLCAPPEKHNLLREKLKLIYVPIVFENNGCQILFHNE